MDPSEGDSLEHRWIGTPRSGRALASLALGVFSLVFLFFTGIPAIALGYLGLVDIRASRGRIRGSWMAMTGIILGALGSTAISLGLILAGLAYVRDQARRDACVQNLRGIALALHEYHRDHNGFPPAAIRDKAGKPLLSWRVAILPYLGPEAASLYAQFNLKEPWDSPNNVQLLDRIPNVFKCPSDDSRRGKTVYQAIVGPGLVFTGMKRVKIAQILDGTSQTIMVVESDLNVPWTSPQDINVDWTRPGAGLGSPHMEVFNAAFADGSVHSIKDSVTAGTLKSLLTRDGGEVISTSSY